MTDEAMRLKLLRESIDKEPPDPEFGESIPADQEFYDGDVPTWSPDGSAPDTLITNYP